MNEKLQRLVKAIEEIQEELDAGFDADRDMTPPVIEITPGGATRMM